MSMCSAATSPDRCEVGGGRGKVLDDLFSGRFRAAGPRWSCATADTSIRKIWEDRAPSRVPTSAGQGAASRTGRDIAAVKQSGLCAGGEEQGFATGVKWELTADGIGRTATLFAMPMKATPARSWTAAILEGGSPTRSSKGS